MASASKLRPIAGNPTFTTEPSMNAKLEAMIVVAITTRGYAGERVPSAIRAVAASKGT
jgi:hypothetical protein